MFSSIVHTWTRPKTFLEERIFYMTLFFGTVFESLCFKLFTSETERFQIKTMRSILKSCTLKTALRFHQRFWALKAPTILIRFQYSIRFCLKTKTKQNNFVYACAFGLFSPVHTKRFAIRKRILFYTFSPVITLRWSLIQSTLGV